MHSGRTVLLVDSDPACGRSLAAVLRRQGDEVRVVEGRAEALEASRRETYDLAIVDLFVEGGGAELARELSRRVPRLVLSLGARLAPLEILEAALGFPVHRKASLPALLRAPRSRAPQRSRRFIQR
jgi:DNA-binding response OmpR family regulator